MDAGTGQGMMEEARNEAAVAVEASILETSADSPVGKLALPAADGDGREPRTLEELDDLIAERKEELDRLRSFNRDLLSASLLQRAAKLGVSWTPTGRAPAPMRRLGFQTERRPPRPHARGGAVTMTPMRFADRGSYREVRELRSLGALDALDALPKWGGGAPPAAEAAPGLDSPPQGKALFPGGGAPRTPSAAPEGPRRPSPSGAEAAAP